MVRVWLTVCDSFAAGSAAKTEAEGKDVEKTVLKQREFEIDAAMVRIMKSRNVLSWNELTSETIRSLKDRFQPDARMLKRRLESLIEREFMARDESNSKTIKVCSCVVVYYACDCV